MSITGFDDLDIAARSILPLTTVRVAAEEMGRQAADCLITLIDRTGSHDNVELSADLITRGSRAPPPGSAPRGTGC